MQKDEKLNIGKNIRAARESAKMSQADLAKAIGAELQQIIRFESGEQNPTVDRIMAIATALKISPGKLL